jgi:hypothetical protein
MVLPSDETNFGAEMKSLTFFNHYGVGDLYESREFILDWMRLYGVDTATYACRYPAVFEDLPQLHCIPVQPDMDMRRAVEYRGSELRLNTWIGARNASTRPSGDYVIWPGVGCVVENLYRMHNDYLREARLRPLPRPVVDYIPTIDYSKINKGNVDQFVKDFSDCVLVLLCNGATGSGHAANFDFMEMVGKLPPWRKTVFIFTERGEAKHPSTFFTDDITLRQPGGSDMLAISYLSTFCSVIVGRCSGAQMPCETRQNWEDPSKTLLSFTQHDNGATFVRNPVALGLKMRRVWSGAETPEAAAAVLAEVLK